jgi:putative colanic acid biosynthesis UDP-glucose lipid carrier transferase
MSTVVNDTKIPNNVDLSSDRRLQRALEEWQPNFIKWWMEMGPEGFQADDVFLRTAVSVDHEGWAHFDYVKMPDYRWGIFLTEQVADRTIGFGDEFGKPAWQQVPGEHRNALRRLAQQPGERRSVAIIGAGALSVRMRRALDARGVDFVGYFDDRADERVQADARAQRLGPLARAAAYVHDHGVQEVYITLPLGSQPRIVGLLEQLQGTTTSVFFVPDVFGISIIQGRLQDLQGVPVVGLCETPFTGINRLVKRGSDLVLASLVLLLTAPLLLALAVGVRLSSPGPVIFRQRRNGLAGEPIEIYKFRSMRVGAEPDDAQASRDDPRVTPFGAFMRRRSLDELPQFVNVLQGRMSVVGPRPHAVAHDQMYEQAIAFYARRHNVKPGITGWAQVNGLRGETDTLEKMQRRIEYDLEYLRNWSLMLDLQIVARTIKLVFWDRHAY